MQHRELERVLGFWAAVSIVIGTAIGSGIFLVPSEMIRAVGTPSMVFLVWIFGGVLSLFGALTYGELSAALPGAGGSLGGAHCDVARTICRRAERALMELHGTENAVPNSEVVRYLNRLSDVLWLMARMEENALRGRSGDDSRV